MSVQPITAAPERFPPLPDARPRRRVRLPFSGWHLFLAPVAAIMLVPLIWMVIVSLETRQQAAGFPIGFANPAIYGLDAHSSSAFHNVTDHPGGASYYEVRSNYTDASNETLPLVTYLRQMGVNGYTGSDVTFAATPAGALGTGSPALPSFTLNLESALVANGGYSDATGVGSPDNYVAAFQSNRGF